MNEIQGNINDFYRSCPIANAVRSQIASTVRTQLVGVQYLPDLQVTNEVNSVCSTVEEGQKLKKTWSMNYE